MDHQKQSGGVAPDSRIFRDTLFQWFWTSGTAEQSLRGGSQGPERSRNPVSVDRHVTAGENNVAERFGERRSFPTSLRARSELSDRGFKPCAPLPSVANEQTTLKISSLRHFSFGKAKIAGF
jgi:hypothetical protein